MNRAYRVFATIAAASFLTGCVSGVKTLSKLININVKDVTGLVIVYSPENRTCEYDLDKKETFLEKLLNITVTKIEPCQCLGVYNITLTTAKDSFRINQYYVNRGDKHYGIKTTDEDSIDNLVVSFLEGSL